MPKRKQTTPQPDVALGDLYGWPAFMIRRAHQIATAVFVESCAELDLTPSQFFALFVLEHLGALGQNELARAVALDRSTTALVVKHLVARGLVTRLDDPRDRRKSLLSLSNAGRLTLSRAERLNSGASRDLMSVFEPKQAEVFLALLNRLNAAFDARPKNGRAVVLSGKD